MKKFLTLFTLMTLIAFGTQAQKQVYTVFNNGTLTYYYDDQMDTRQGIKEVYKPGSITPRFQDYCTEVKIGVIDASMKEAPLTSLKYMFYGNHYYNGSRDFSFPLENMTSISGLENLNTAIVTDMESMFQNCKSLQSLDLISFNTAKVTNMQSMFYYCNNLKGIKGLEKFNTANVEDMGSMFQYCKSLTSIDLRSFAMDKVTEVSYMFDGCSNLTTIYCDADWSTITGLASSGLFRDCYKLVGGSGTIHDNHKYDASYALPDGKDGKKGYFTGTMPVYSVYSANTLTFYCDYKMDSRLGFKEVYNPAAKRFEGYNEMVTSAVIDPSMKNAQLTSLRYMFYSEDGSYFGNLPNLTTITGLEYLNTANVTDMSGMFTGCWALTDPLNLSNFNTANVTNMNFMFGGCSELTELDLTAFDVDKVTSMDYMFTNCKKLKTIYCEKDWTTGAVTSSTNMFDNCKVIQGDNGTKWAAGNPKDISYARPDGGTENPGYFSQKPTEGIENIQPSVVSTQKVIRDGQLYIMYNGTMYNVQGLKVK